MDPTTSACIGVVLLLAFAIISITYLRNFICWYYKVNERINKIDELIELNEQLVKQNEIIINILKGNKDNTATDLEEQTIE